MDTYISYPVVCDRCKTVNTATINLSLWVKTLNPKWEFHVTCYECKSTMRVEAEVKAKVIETKWSK